VSDRDYDIAIEERDQAIDRERDLELQLMRMEVRAKGAELRALAAEARVAELQAEVAQLVEDNLAYLQASLSAAATKRAAVVADIKQLRSDWADNYGYDGELKAYGCDYILDRIERGDHLKE
jgi:hypothetical protein